MAKLDFSKYLNSKGIINLFVILGFLVFIIPTLITLGKEISEESQNLAKERARISSLSQTIGRLAELRESAKQADEALSKLQGALPQRDDLFSFPRYIEADGRKKNLALTTSFTGNEVDPTGNSAGISSFKISGVGSFTDTLRFIQDLELGKTFFVNLTSIDVTQSEESFKSSINGSVFFRG